MERKLADDGVTGKAARPMDLALAEAIRARDLGEVPIGAVVVSADGEVLASAGNRTLGLARPDGACRAACHPRGLREARQRAAASIAISM